MKISFIVLIVFCLVLPTAASAQIYKIVDKDGNVVFTDVPPKGGEQNQSEAVTLSQHNDYREDEASPQAPELVELTDDTAEEEAQPITYERIFVVSPENDAPVRENAGNVNISVGVDPVYDPASGHLIQLIMDGVVVQSSPSTQFNLENVDRGTHTISVQIVNAKGTILASSEPSTFHMMRYSALLVRPVKEEERKCKLPLDLFWCTH